ncbi:uncharacterized protein LOC144446095 [Glandiceps talaboti]
MADSGECPWSDSCSECAECSTSSQLGFEDTFDPFEKLDRGDTIPGPKHGKSKAEFESEKYLSSLESKLDRLKGKTKPPSSKDIVRTLHDAKEDHLGRMLKESTSTSSSINAASIASADDDEVKASAVRRRVFPEQPLTVEEMQCLLERDYLNNITQVMHQASLQNKQ